MKTKPMSWIYLLVLTLVAPLALAQGKTTVIKMVDGKVVEVEQVDNPPPGDVFNSFSETDANSDGRISAQEARDAGILRLGAADKNGDGYLYEQEYSAAASMPDGLGG